MGLTSFKQWEEKHVLQWKNPRCTAKFNDFFSKQEFTKRRKGSGYGNTLISL
jgi:hypothetical protein